MHGSGELIKWMRHAKKEGDYSIIDGYFEVFLIINYNFFFLFRLLLKMLYIMVEKENWNQLQN